jgi:hypothetical protein
MSELFRACSRLVPSISVNFLHVPTVPSVPSSLKREASYGPTGRISSHLEAGSERMERSEHQGESGNAWMTAWNSSRSLTLKCIKGVLVAMRNSHRIVPHYLHTLPTSIPGSVASCVRPSPDERSRALDQPAGVLMSLRDRSQRDPRWLMLALAIVAASALLVLFLRIS